MHSKYKSTLLILVIMLYIGTTAALTASNSTPLPDMVLVDAGSFLMGTATHTPDEQPIHRVEFTNSFLIGRYEVTYDEFDRFSIATKRSLLEDIDNQRGSLPARDVQWFQAITYCNWLSNEHGFTPCYNSRGTIYYPESDGYRMPTEAEWEYAARGGSLSEGYIFAGSDDAQTVAWYGTSADKVHPVGQKPANELGLYDMSGNVWEWCYDWYGTTYYADSSENNPTGPLRSDIDPQYDGNRVRRGGSYNEASFHCMIIARSYDGPKQRDRACGFRLVRTVF